MAERGVRREESKQSQEENYRDILRAYFSDKEEASHSRREITQVYLAFIARQAV